MSFDLQEGSAKHPELLERAFLPRFGCFVARVFFPLSISICSFSECFFGRILI